MVAYDPQVPWVREQNELWRELAGATITGWEGFDEHIGRDDDELTFLGRGDPFRQLGVLRMKLGDGSAIDFATFQNEEFGLALSPADGPLRFDSGYARPSDLGDLPVGPVDRLEIHVSDYPWTDFDPIEALLTIAGRSVLIVAAEVRPDWEGFNYCWGDESFFVFADPSNADAIDWKGGARRFATREIGPGPDGGDVFDGSRRTITRVTTSQILKSQYPIVRWRAGYDIDETQDLLEQILATLLYYQCGRVDGAAATPTTAEELRGIALQPTKFRPGFGQPEVDAMISNVVATLEEYERR